MAGWAAIQSKVNRIEVTGGKGEGEVNKILLLLLRLIGFHFVPENCKAAVTRFGMYNRVRGPGLFWVAPFVERVESIIKVGMRFATFKVTQVLSRDGIPFDFELTVFYSFDPDSAISHPIADQLVRQPDHVLENIVKDYADQSLRRTVAQYNAEDIYIGGPIADIEQGVIEGLKAQGKHLGLAPIADSGVMIKEIIPPEDFLDTILTAKGHEIILRVLTAYEAADVDRALLAEWVRLFKDAPEVLSSLPEFIKLPNSLKTVLTANGTMVKEWHWEFNPYKPGPPIREPHLFFGRQKAMQTILDGLREVHFAIHGPRRIGKTSLLYQLEHRLQELTHPTYLFVPVFVQLQRVPEAELFQRLIRLIAEAASQHTGPLSLLADDKRTDYDDVDFTDDLETIVEAVRRGRDKEARIVLLLDEGEQLNEYSRDTQKQFRGVLMDAIGQEHLRLVWSGLGITPIKDDTSPWYNLFAPPIYLAPLDQETAVRLIIEPVKGIFQYDEAAITLILEQSGGRPYEVQSLCHAVIEHVKHRIQGQKVSPPVRVTAEDVKAAVRQPSQVPTTETQYETPSLSRQVAEGQSEYDTAGDDE